MRGGRSGPMHGGRGGRMGGGPMGGMNSYKSPYIFASQVLIFRMFEILNLCLDFSQIGDEI